LAKRQVFDSFDGLFWEPVDLSAIQFNSHGNIVLRDLGFFQMNEDLKKGKRNALCCVNGWNSLGIIPAAVQPRTFAAQVGMSSPYQPIGPQM
jgi:hypothetical protein